jgi:hypothetical protein
VGALDGDRPRRAGRRWAEPAVVGHDLQTEFTYDGGKYDRYEREFYGFRMVGRTGPDDSYVVRTYLNGSFANKGLLEQEELWDRKDGKLFTLTKRSFMTVLADSSPATVGVRASPHLPQRGSVLPLVLDAAGARGAPLL